MPKKIIIVLFLIVFGIIAYFGYPIVKNRYFNNAGSTKDDIENTKNTDSAKTITNDELIDDNDDESTDSESDSEVKDEVDESGDNVNITASDCDNDCLNFKDNESDLKYCKNICGLSANESNDNCESKVGSDRDYCFKDQAIAKTDLKICDSISDLKIKSSCKNRITEDLLEQQ